MSQIVKRLVPGFVLHMGCGRQEPMSVTAVPLQFVFSKTKQNKKLYPGCPAPDRVFRVSRVKEILLEKERLALQQFTDITRAGLNCNKASTGVINDA
jgi:hypothetical protein